MFSLCHCNYLVLVGENTLICLNRQTVFFSANQLCVCVCVWCHGWGLHSEQLCSISCCASNPLETHITVITAE